MLMNVTPQRMLAPTVTKDTGVAWLRSTALLALLESKERTARMQLSEHLRAMLVSDATRALGATVETPIAPTVSLAQRARTISLTSPNV